MKFKFLAVLAALMLCACCGACSPRGEEDSKITVPDFEDSGEVVEDSVNNVVEDSEESNREAEDSSEVDSQNSNPGPDDSQDESNISTADSGENSTVGDTEGIYDSEGKAVDAEDLPTVLQNDGTSTQSEVASEDDMADYEIYYGTVSEVTPDGFEVTGYEHRDFGNEKIRFLVNDDTKYEGEADNFGDIAAGDFVQVYHDGKMTRSIPPQCFAAKVVKSAEDMFVMNCEVVEAPVKNGDNYQVLVASLDDARNQSVLTYSADTDVAVVGDLLVGTKITVLTKGIATMSLPPQVPVVQIAEYQE